MSHYFEIVGEITETAMKQGAPKTRFAVCVRNDDHPASLEVRKIYKVLSDSEAAKRKLLRVVDESGEDYLYPADFFIPIELPQAAKEMFITPTAV
jgi:hypothetical protein